MRRWQRWLNLALGTLARLGVLAAVFLLAAGLGAVTISVYQHGVPFSGGGALQRIQDPAAQNEPEQTAGTTEAGSLESESTQGDTVAKDAEKRDDHTVGVWYSSTDQRWAIFNEDLAEMPEDAVFDVYVLPEDESAFVHYTTADNISEDGTYLYNPLINGDPNADPRVTQNWNPGGSGGAYNDHRVGVRYDAAAQAWVAFNEDGAQMLEGVAFNVGVIPRREPDFVHRSNAENSMANWTYLDSPLVNGNPNAIIFIAQR